MKKLFLGAACMLGALCLMPSTTSAQAMGSEYKTGIGVQFGYWSGSGGAISVKHFMHPTSALEGLFYFGNHWMSLTGLYEYHGAFPDAPGLKWYVGPGAHATFYSGANSSDARFGLDGVLGLDYKITGAPISASLDVHPRLDFPSGNLYFGAGLGVRFTF